MEIIRNFGGGWPEWTADLDDGRVVSIYMRYGEVHIGVGKDAEDAYFHGQRVASGQRYLGVMDAVDALVILQKKGYNYVAPVKPENLK